MQLYLVSQIEALSKEKWGNTEPYIVALREFDERYLSWLADDAERLQHLTPEKFQYLVADRLEQFGLCVQLTGNINRKDGGIDIIAYPSAPTIPFMLAVQVKHHRSARKTTAGDVRDLHGVVASAASPFHFGMLVTNTAFSPDAHWFADNNQTFLRLRDISHLQRWLRNDFANEYEWREIPRSVQLAPGIVIEIPRPTIVVPECF